MSIAIAPRLSYDAPVSVVSDEVMDWWLQVCEEDAEYGHRREQRLEAALGECMETIEILEGARDEAGARLQRTVTALRDWLGEHGDGPGAEQALDRHLANLLDLIPASERPRPIPTTLPANTAPSTEPEVALAELQARWPQLRVEQGEDLPDAWLAAPEDLARLLDNLVAATGEGRGVLRLCAESVTDDVGDEWEITITVVGDAGGPGGLARVDAAVDVLRAAGLAAAARLAGAWGGVCQTDHGADGAVTCRCRLRLSATAPWAGR